MSLTVNEEISDRQKLTLLQELLDSPALGRSGQLRQLLRYLVVEEIEGRGSSLTEYSIGVNALGRHTGYSPESDSSVRTRAHELRRRLDEFYASAPSGSWRIELPRGTWRPRFVPHSPSPSAAIPVSPPSRRLIVAFAAGFLFALVLLTAYLWSRPRADSDLRRIWGPLLTPGASVTIALAAPLQLWVREFQTGALPSHGDPPFLVPVPTVGPIADWYARHRRRPSPGYGLYLHPNLHSPLWGEAAGAVTLAGFLASHSVQSELLSDRNARPAILKSRHSIILGRSDYNLANLPGQPVGGFSIRYLPERGETVIVDSSGAVRFTRQPGGNLNYGLVTAWTRPSNHNDIRTFSFSGINSDASQAAVDYMTSPAGARDLAAYFKQTLGRVPTSFQAVVRTTSSDSYTIQFERAAAISLEK
jgi:hypothetical protein